jgi:hypothetical protein
LAKSSQGKPPGVFGPVQYTNFNVPPYLGEALVGVVADVAGAVVETAVETEVDGLEVLVLVLLEVVLVLVLATVLLLVLVVAVLDDDEEQPANTMTNINRTATNTKTFFTDSPPSTFPSSPSESRVNVL